jgi:hypothetical protein
MRVYLYNLFCNLVFIAVIISLGSRHKSGTTGVTLVLIGWLSSLLGEENRDNDSYLMVPELACSPDD